MPLFRTCRSISFINVKKLCQCWHESNTLWYEYRTLVRSKVTSRNVYTTPDHMIRKFRHGRDHAIPDEAAVKENKTTKSLLEEAVTPDGEQKLHYTDVWHSDPYEDIRKYRKKQNQAAYRVTPDINPQDTSVLLFPGQGTQFVGMAKDLLEYPNVRNMYEAAAEILEYDILKLSLEGPASDLNQTKYQQPAILLSSLAAIEKIRNENPEVLESCVATAGFSIGELTALAFAGALSFENAVRLVKVRGEAMQIVSELNRSGMMTVFFGPDSRLKFACSVAKEYCKKIGLEDVDCRVANYLFPHCKVVAGNEEALEFIIKNKDDFKLKKIRRLNVSGAFHTDLMKPAALVFKEAIDNVIISNPLLPVYSNVDGRTYRDPKHIRNQLPKQIYSPVRWEQILHTIYERPAETPFPRTFECGPGNTLKTILKMVNLKAYNNCYSVVA